MKINLIIIYTAADLSMYKARKSRLKLKRTFFVFKKQPKPVWVNWPKMIRVIWQEFRFFQQCLDVGSFSPNVSNSLSCQFKIQIQWFPFLYQFIMSSCVKNILKVYFKTQKMPAVKLLVTVYSKHLQSISVHVLTDIHRSLTEGKSSPFTRHPIRSKTKKAGRKTKLNIRGQSQKDAEPRRLAGCAEVCLSSNRSAPFLLSYDDARIQP